MLTEHTLLITMRLHFFIKMWLIDLVTFNLSRKNILAYNINRIYLSKLLNLSVLQIYCRGTPTNKSNTYNICIVFSPLSMSCKRQVTMTTKKYVEF